MLCPQINRIQIDHKNSSDDVYTLVDEKHKIGDFLSTRCSQHSKSDYFCQQNISSLPSFSHSLNGEWNDETPLATAAGGVDGVESATSNESCVGASKAGSETVGSSGKSRFNFF